VSLDRPAKARNADLPIWDEEHKLRRGLAQSGSLALHIPGNLAAMVARVSDHAPSVADGTVLVGMFVAQRPRSSFFDPGYLYALVTIMFTR